VHPLLRLPWAALGAAAELGSALASPDGAKWQRSLAARRGQAQRWHDHASARDAQRPLAWFHAPSVGEGLQALPVVQRLQAAPNAPQIGLTWFSPSAAAFAARFKADIGDYLPFDTARGADLVLEAMRPSALVYSKLDVWPVLTERTRKRGVPVGMIAATLRPSSGRTKPLAQALLSDAYAALQAVGAISSDDADRLASIGVRPEVIEVTGDTRYDQVWERAQRPPTDAPWRAALADQRPTLVAGSTWPSDEAVLLPAWQRVARDTPSARLVIAPHEPTPDHLDPIRRWAADAALRLATLDAPDVADADVVLIDRVGVLGDCYGIATAAFVGGGFHDAGLHSVLEPAAFGAPVAFGPRHIGNRDAQRLLAAQGAATASDADGLHRILGLWMRDPSAARGNGEAAQRVVQSELGAAERSVGLVRRLLALGR
jgi:3-deoxy-D-manno-octulosonic-acid transferase